MKTKKRFQFLNPGRLVDGDLELVLAKKTPADPVKGYVPGYEFEMRHPGESTAIGTIRLRIGTPAELRYPGHIGYEVKQEFRGRRYAARSCRLLAPLARAHGLSAVWLTVDPANIPSQKTCLIIGATYVETVRIPKDHEMYAQGARFRRRYRLNLRRQGRHPNQPADGALLPFPPEADPPEAEKTSPQNCHMFKWNDLKREKAIPRKIEDNARVVMTEWRCAPGSETGWHRHTMDYCIVYLTPAKFSIETKDGKREVTLKAGESYFRKAGVEHNAINAGENEIVMIEMELK